MLSVITQLRIFNKMKWMTLKMFHFNRSIFIIMQIKPFVFRRSEWGDGGQSQKSSHPEEGRTESPFWWQESREGAHVGRWLGEVFSPGAREVVCSDHSLPHCLASWPLSERGREGCPLEAPVGVWQQAVEDRGPGTQKGQSVVNALWRAVPEGRTGLLRFYF